MAQKVKVQDGIITYSASDSLNSVNFNVDGLVNVTKELSVGDDPLADGVITTSDNIDLILTTGLNGNLVLNPENNIVLKGVLWPDGTETASAGKFLGTTSLNTLQYLSFNLGNVLSDDETDAQLNILFPNSSPGQFAVGPNVLYKALGSGNWAILGSGSGDSTVPYYIPISSTYVVNLYKQALFHMPIEIDGNLIIDGFLIEV